jgi:hypothetical protein
MGGGGDVDCGTDTAGISSCTARSVDGGGGRPVWAGTVTTSTSMASPASSKTWVFATWCWGAGSVVLLEAVADAFDAADLPTEASLRGDRTGETTSTCCVSLCTAMARGEPREGPRDRMEKAGEATVPGPVPGAADPAAEPE